MRCHCISLSGTGAVGNNLDQAFRRRNRARGDVRSQRAHIGRRGGTPRQKSWN